MTIDVTDPTPGSDLSPELQAFIEGLPKCELHVHLEGTLSPELKLELANRNGIDLAEKTVEEIQATYRLESLTAFLGVVLPGHAGAGDGG